MASFRPTFNVGGLASGLDTNAIIEQLLTIERQPQVRLAQRQRVEEARQQALRDVMTRVQNLQTAAAGLRDPTIWNDTQTVESSDTTKVAVARTGGAAAGAYELTVTQLARAHQVMQGGAITQAAADDVLHVSVGGGTAVDVAIAAGDTLETIASKLNSASGTPVYASVVNSKLVLTGRTTGAASTIAVTSDGSLAGDLAFAESQAAQDAQYTVDGVAKTSATNTIANGIVGITLTLKARTTTAVTVTVGAPGPDTAKIQEKVKAFVDQYNSTIDFVRARLTEKRVPNATTDADRAKGVLENDAQLGQLLSSLRAAIAEPVSGRPSDLNLLAQIGISTGAATGGGTPSADAIAGKLTLDAGKLADELANRFADVKALLTNPTGAYATDGLSQRLGGILDAQVASGTGMLSARIASEQSAIDLLRQRQSDLDLRIAQKEQQLRRQFSTLESVLSQLQSQNAYVSSQLAKLQA